MIEPATQGESPPLRARAPSVRELYDEELAEGESVRNFILQSWLRSHLRDWPGHVSLCAPAAAAAYWQSHQIAVKLAIGRSRVFVVHDDENEQIVYGYIVVEEDPKGDIAHYAYVKEAFRRRGFAKTLFAVAGHPTRASHVAPVSAPWLATRMPCEYDPTLLWRR